MRRVVSWVTAWLLPAVVAATWASTACAQQVFPFVVSYDSPDNVTNISAWADAPAGRHGFVRAEGGRLVTDAGPIRFWGTNLCFDACFPTHEQAERVAARLARLGINVVRLHHMDARSIWGKSPDHLTIDPEQLEKLDYLIAQLKKHGIYVNINLHVSRWLGPKEGFPNREGRPKYDKGLDNFEPRMIELQKKYARDLLTHVNAYTGKPYTREPAVAFIEINNENAAFTSWSRGWLDELPEPYSTTYRKLWNQWLRQRYGSTARLRSAWNAEAQPLGKEMLVNGDFTKSADTGWRMERDRQTDVQWSVQTGGPSGRFLRIVVRRQGEVSWRPQLLSTNFPVKKGQAYTLSFYVRSDASRKISVAVMMDHEPWQRLGLSASVPVGPEWREKRFSFVAEQDDSRARVSVTGLQPGTYELAAVSLRPGGIIGLRPEERLEDDSVQVVLWRQRGITPQRFRDFVDFLYDTEQKYWWDFYRFLKDELGVRSLVTGTQLNYSPVFIQAAFDYLDSHAYWQHPAFPGRPWDPNNWYVRNVALVNSPGGTLSRLAVRRVGGKAFTVSEYNHPAPNLYAAEGFPMLAAFGAFQNWDAIYSFTYSHSTEFEPTRITGYFDVKSDSTKLVHFPACAALFKRGDVAPARRTVIVPLTREKERQLLHETGTPWTLTAEHLGLDPRVSLLHAVALALKEEAGGKRTPRPALPRQSGNEDESSPPALPKDLKRFQSDTGQIVWDVSQKDKGFFLVNTPRTKLFTGFVAGREFQLGNVRLRIGKTHMDWATVTLTCIDGPTFDQPGRILLAATGWAMNTGAKLEQLGKDRVTLRRNWGKEPLLCEGIPAEVELPVPASRVRCFALDQRGDRKQAVVCRDRDGHAVLAIGPSYRTLWYEIQIR